MGLAQMCHTKVEDSESSFQTPSSSHPEVWILETSQPFNIGGRGHGF